MFVIVIINCCSLFFSYMFISPISFKELQIASWKVRETNREEASKETAQGTWGSIPSHLYQRHIRLWLKQGLTWVSNKQAKSRLRKSRQEPRGERMTVLLHQEKPIWNARLTIRRNKWERCSLGCSCPQSKSTGTLTLFTRKVVKSCLQPSPEGIVRVWKKKHLKITRLLLSINTTLKTISDIPKTAHVAEPSSGFGWPEFVSYIWSRKKKRKIIQFSKTTV